MRNWFVGRTPIHNNNHDNQFYYITDVQINKFDKSLYIVLNTNGPDEDSVKFYFKN